MSPYTTSALPRPASLPALRPGRFDSTFNTSLLDGLSQNCSFVSGYQLGGGMKFDTIAFGAGVQIPWSASLNCWCVAEILFTSASYFGVGPQVSGEPGNPMANCYQAILSSYGGNVFWLYARVGGSTVALASSPVPTLSINTPYRIGIRRVGNEVSAWCGQGVQLSTTVSGATAVPVGVAGLAMWDSGVTEAGIVGRLTAQWQG